MQKQHKDLLFCFLLIKKIKLCAVYLLLGMSQCEHLTFLDLEPPNPGSTELMQIYENSFPTSSKFYTRHPWVSFLKIYPKLTVCAGSKQLFFNVRKKKIVIILSMYKNFNRLYLFFFLKNNNKKNYLI